MVVQEQRGPAIHGNRSVRIGEAILAVWLFVSAFAWPHSLAQKTNTWIVALLVFLISVLGAAVPRARYLNTILAVWLFVSAWALPSNSLGTIWNNGLVAIGIFVFSLMPSAPVRSRPAALS